MKLIIALISFSISLLLLAVFTLAAYDMITPDITPPAVQENVWVAKCREAPKKLNAHHVYRWGWGSLMPRPARCLIDQPMFDHTKPSNLKEKP